MREQWKPVAGWEDFYEVSDLGRVRRRSTLRIKVASLDRGYEIVGLCAPGRKMTRCAVHRLVLQAFVGPAPKNHDGGHLDGTRDNNRLDNLAWVSRGDNQLHRHAHGTALWGQAAPWAKLTHKQVAEIRALSGIVGPTELGSRYGVNRSVIRKIISGQVWSVDPTAARAAAVAKIGAAKGSQQ